MKTNCLRYILIFLFSAILSVTVEAQKHNPIVFAVLANGSIVSPIAEIEDKKMLGIDAISMDEARLRTFGNYRYNPGKEYSLIFGGRENGKVIIEGFDPSVGCGKNMAMVSVKSDRAKLGGTVTALATDYKPKKEPRDTRRAATMFERQHVTLLVAEAFRKLKYSPEAIKTLTFQNLTVIDPDDDRRIELVGTAYIKPTPKDRVLVFFISGFDSKGDFGFGYANFEKYDESMVMSGEIEDLNRGFYSEVILDSLDYDDDGVNEIFTHSEGFEGTVYKAYKKQGDLWVKSFEGYNYRCAY